MSFFGNLGDIRPLLSTGVDDPGPYLSTVGSRLPFRTSSVYSDISPGPFKTGCSYLNEPDCIFDMYTAEHNDFAPGFEDESHTMEDFHTIPTQSKVSDMELAEY
ncbi:hypothetical protein ACJ73_09048 [Blastomyces percursus]|uniref:Uncharacterized protein n=1 Tax=Blastomyces percursus TaxID=1658174 RepID=A0A1J9PFI0_9EURO|nr:hypothetical protein ACJ73_09048 [Blastomyces percursus]